MIKSWIQKAVDFLDHSLTPVPQELNELDWKEELSPDNAKLCRHLSAFANQPGGGFMVFGIEDKTTSLAGVSQKSAELIVQRLGSLCRDSLNPVVTMDHAIENYQGIPLLFVHIRESAVKPVHLAPGTMEDAYIRSGGSTRKASRQEIGGLMLNSKTPQFEELHASKLKSTPEILDILDYRSIYKLLGKPVPQSNDEVLHWMKDEKMIDEVDGAGFYITNFGALAAAQNLKDFDGLARKSIRLIKYTGINKLETEKEFPGSKGYAIGFEGLIEFTKALLPGSEIIKNALRTETTVYPEIAIRELVANALIHQDFSIRGSVPMIEIFADRIEISNPGKLLPSKKIDRLIRTTPESRNEILAAAFRRYNICEERGSGFEKAVAAIELFGLPPLKFEELESSFRVTMYSPRSFAELTPTERVEACYQHSIIKYYSSGGMTNSSLRERFKMHDKQRPQVSLVIKEALAQGKIKPKDPNNVSTKFAEYIPSWG
ncbi:MAG: ATP-binding protein [Trichlorobacter sp.]|jgi:predicted HTH transcriptional regulator